MRWVLALAGSALFLFVAVLGIYGWDFAWQASGLVLAATKWSTPDLYDDD